MNRNLFIYLFKNSCIRWSLEFTNTFDITLVTSIRKLRSSSRYQYNVKLLIKYFLHWHTNFEALFYWIWCIVADRHFAIYNHCAFFKRYTMYSVFEYRTNLPVYNFLRVMKCRIVSHELENHFRVYPLRHVEPILLRRGRTYSEYPCPLTVSVFR